MNIQIEFNLIAISIIAMTNIYIHIWHNLSDSHSDNNINLPNHKKRKNIIRESNKNSIHDVQDYLLLSSTLAVLIWD